VEGSTTKGSDPISRNRITWSIKRVVKAAIVVLVVVGLVLAGRAAVRQWNDQRRVAVGRVAEIDQLIRQAKTHAAQTRLLADRETALRQVPDLANLRWSKITGAALLYAIGLIPGGLVLREAAGVLGYRVRRRDAVSAQILGHLGKYVPGKAMVVVIRAGRLSKSGVPVLAGSIAVFIETLLMMSVGAAVAGGLVFLLPVPRWIAWSALVGGVAATLLATPPVVNRGIRRFGNRGDSRAEAPAAVQATPGPHDPIGCNWRFSADACGWQLAAWGCIGASFACLVESLPGGPRGYPMTTIVVASFASIALAMVAGFASLLPGGAGVRELTLAVVLAPIIGASQSLLAAILARLVFLVVELLASAAVAWWHRFREATTSLE
jgi:uncharacterized membrane protein YbhN (UPF0104 family)